MSFNEARKEAELVMFGVIDELLVKTGVKTKDIRILVVNCSLFNPAPSLSAMVVNRYKPRGNILSYNLSGMGCSAGLISIDLAKRLLQVYTITHHILCTICLFFCSNIYFFFIEKHIHIICTCCKHIFYVYFLFISLISRLGSIWDLLILLKLKTFC